MAASNSQPELEMSLLGSSSSDAGKTSPSMNDADYVNDPMDGDTLSLVREGDDALVIGVDQGSMSWITTGFTIVAYMLGAGMLGMPFAFKSLGIGLALVLLITASLVMLYTGLILGWLHGTRGGIRGYPDLAIFFGEKNTRTTRKVLQGLFYSFLIGLCTLHLLTMKVSLMQILQSCHNDTTAATKLDIICEREACSNHGVVSLPNSLWLAISAVFVFPFVHFRSVAKARWLSYIGTVSILIADIIIVCRCIYEASEHDHTNAHPSGSFSDIANGITTIVFAFGGHVVMVDFINEMRHAEDYPRSLNWAQLFMAINYALIGLLGYFAFGDDVQPVITLNMPPDGLNTFTNVCLFLHVGAAYCLNSTVIVKNMCDGLWPGLLDSTVQLKEKRLRWGVLSSGVLLVAFTLSVLIPFFNDIMTIYSSVGIFLLSLAIPGLLFLATYHRRALLVSRIFNGVLVVFATAGMVCGLYAAFDDTIQRWQRCPVSFS